MESETDLVNVILSLDISNDEIGGHMAVMKTARESRPAVSVTCTVSGFDRDQRELFDIPEARAFARRLVTTGFISYLDPATQFGGRDMPALGALEVWLCAEGLAPGGAVTLTADLMARFHAALAEANAVADAKLGPFRSPGAG